jgi:SAM-dependent methyltransferase
MDDRSVHALSFGPAAHRYERGRPPYPAAALDWLLPDGAPRVLDLGAGTGKLTRQIHGRGLPVTAVDPSEGMLAELRRVLPDVPAHLGSAERIPLPDDSVDAVVVAQAWHWMDPVHAPAEVARVLSPGGRLGLVWNLRDKATDWVHRLDRLIGTAEDQLSPRIGPPFGPAETREFRWTHRLGPDELLDLVASRSHIILMRSDERAAVLAQVRQLLITHPDLVGRTEFDLPYATLCVRASLA